MCGCWEFIFKWYLQLTFICILCTLREFILFWMVIARIHFDFYACMLRVFQILCDIYNSPFYVLCFLLRILSFHGNFRYIILRYTWLLILFCFFSSTCSSCLGALCVAAKNFFCVVRGDILFTLYACLLKYFRFLLCMLIYCLCALCLAAENFLFFASYLHL
jgi:hypothetical protein